MIYQVGGSLRSDALSYVERPCDRHLYEALRRGEFCYVFNCRQMGKSSLLVRTRHQLQREGYQCASLDLTRIGGEKITPLQWYKGIVADLRRGFGLSQKFDLKTWWQESENISFLQRLSYFISDILLPAVADDKIVIFIDEIDSILSLDFPVDDFFALIRSCYNQKATEPKFNRLTFAIFGVATPSDLIRDHTRTPFNIGTAIALSGFSLTEAEPLARGLPFESGQKREMIGHILDWTNGQPFLTQKLCQMISEVSREQSGNPPPVPPGTEKFWVADIVRNSIIEEWEWQDEPEHLKTIRDRLLRNPQRAGQLLGIYQKILQHQSVAVDNSRGQTELLLSGLAVKERGQLKVKNLVYENVFNPEWVAKQLSDIRPYSQAFDAWVASGQTDESRLLRGRALKDTQIWAMGKSLSDLDYQFLAASVELDRQEVQNRLEIERSQAIAAQLKEANQRLLQEQKNANLQKILLAVVGTGFLISSGLGWLAFGQYKEARINEIKALASSSESLLTANRQLDAMVAAIAAKRKLESLETGDRQTQKKVKLTLNKAIYGTYELNHLTGHKGSVTAVNISPDLQFLATGGEDRTARIWRSDGTLLHILKHTGAVWRVVFTPDSRHLVSASLDGTVKVWRVDGTLVKSFQTHKGPAWGLAVSPDGEFIASSGGDKAVKLWTLDGQLLKTFNGHQNIVRNVAFSPDGKTIASAAADNTIKLWGIDGGLLKTLKGHQKTVWGVKFCPSNDLLVSVSNDFTAKLWKLDGTLVRTIPHYRAFVEIYCREKYIVTIDEENLVQHWSPDGSWIREFHQFRSPVGYVAMAADDSMQIVSNNEGEIKLWKLDHHLLKRLAAHRNVIWKVAAGDGQLIASTSVDETLKLWRSDGTLLQTLKNRNTTVFRTAVFSRDGRILATGSVNQTVQIWDVSHPETSEIKLLKTWVGHRSPVNALAIAPDNRTLASGGARTIKFWNFDGQLLRSFPAHDDIIWKLAFSPDGQRIASASADGIAKIWTTDGSLVATLDHDGPVWGVGFSPRGDFLATSSRDDTLKIWTLEGQLLKTISNEGEGLNGLAISPDGQIIATAGVDTNIKLWRPTGELLATLPGHQSMVFSVAFTGDGNSLISGGQDGAVIIWNLNQIRQLNPLNYACDWVRDYLRTNPDLEEGDRALCDPIRH